MPPPVEVADGGDPVGDLSLASATQGAAILTGSPPRAGSPGLQGTLLMTRDAGATWSRVRLP